MFLVKKIFVPKGSKIVPIVFLDPEGSKRYYTDECSICLDKINEFNKAKMPCGHYFHSDCILDWIGKKKYTMDCPVCRQALNWTLIKSNSE